ncbi:MAG TPA: class D beta-lactamase [Bacteroidia bacterium]|jgi:beta-lactamase class D|nr:class D beta-lactamase [Bacteroidia bacterium]
MRTSFILFIIILISVSCKHQPTTEVRDDFKKYYDENNVNGCFALYDLNNDKYLIYDTAEYRQQFLPCSTFKICNTLIGLETGVIPDENYVIKWDSVVRWVPEWNQDLDLKSAFKYSAVWYYQELARRVGGKRMKYWLDTVPYGNADTSGGIDKFWLWGGLRISPQEQIAFIKRIHDNKLPFSKRSVDILKKIMILKDSANYTFRGKTGWGFINGQEVGWFVGYIEANNDTYIFSNFIHCDTALHNKIFVNARKGVALKILNSLKLSPDHL